MVTVEEGLNWKNSIMLRDERFNLDRTAGVIECSLLREHLPPARALL
jgi:hypothetical protein